MLFSKRNFSRAIAFVVALLMLSLGGVSALALSDYSAEQFEGYDVTNINGQIIFGSPYVWEDEAIQNVASQLPDYSVKALFENDGIYTYLITLKNYSQNAEACELLKSVSDAELVITNYFYMNDTDALNQLQESNDYHKGDVDGDSELNATDYLNVKQAFLGQIELGKKASVMADIDNNGTIDGTDYLLIKSHFLGDMEISKDGFFGGKNVSEYKVKLDSMTKMDMAKDYIEFRNQESDFMFVEVIISAVSGSYNGAYVMKMSFNSVPEVNVLVEKEVGGVVFNVSVCADLVAYKDGSFYSLEDAFEQGIVSAEDLEIARSVYNTSVCSMKPYLA